MPGAPRVGYSWFRTRGGRRFGMEFTAVVIAKLAALALLWWFCFEPWPHPDVTPAGVAGHVLAPAASTRAAHDD